MRSNTETGANRVQVNVLSCEKICKPSHRKQESLTVKLMAYSVWKGDQHEGLTGPDVQMVRIQEEDRLTISISACRHFQFDIFIFDVFLEIIHSRKIKAWSFMDSGFSLNYCRNIEKARLASPLASVVAG